jgi:hypothetical protein
MVHPTARIIKDRIINRDDFYLYHGPRNIQINWPTQILTKDERMRIISHHGFIYMCTYMWWCFSNFKDKWSIEHKYQVEKYIVGDDESYGNQEEKMNLLVRQNICMANKIHTCHYNGNPVLHEQFLNTALRRYLHNYVRELLLIIENLTPDDIKSIMCNIFKITDDIYEIRWDLEEHHSNEYYMQTLRELEMMVCPLTNCYNKYGHIYY